MRIISRAAAGRWRILSVAGVTAALLCAQAAAGAATPWTVGVAGGTTAAARAGGAPGTPTNVGATCNALVSGSITVNWSAVTRATTYTVLKSTTGADSGYSTAASGIGSTSWSSPALSAGTYYFKIQAVAGTNWTGSASAASNSRTITAALLCT